MTKPQLEEVEAGGDCGENAQKAPMLGVWRQRSKDSFFIYF